LSARTLLAFSNRMDAHKEVIAVILRKGFHSSTRGLGNGLGRIHSRYPGLIRSDGSRVTHPMSR
jgi:hypothetical protein